MNIRQLRLSVIFSPVGIILVGKMRGPHPTSPKGRGSDGSIINVVRIHNGYNDIVSWQKPQTNGVCGFAFRITLLMWICDNRMETFRTHEPCAPAWVMACASLIMVPALHLPLGRRSGGALFYIGPIYPRFTAFITRSAMLRASSFWKRLLRWASTVFSEMNRRCAISFDVSPPAMACSTSISRCDGWSMPLRIIPSAVITSSQ